MRENLAEIVNSHPEVVRAVSESLVELRLAREIVDAIGEAKAMDITLLDVRESFALSDYFIVASGRSDRHVQGIINKVLEYLEKNNIPVLSLEGLEDGHWVLLDAGDFVLHVFYGPVRAEYDLESLWHSAKRLAVAS